MAEERDPRVSGRYRELGAEVPPSALDAKILAAARRAVRAAPEGAGIDPWAPGARWYVPVAAAAVLVLAVAVGVHVEREQPDDVAPTARQKAPSQPAAAEASKRAAPPPQVATAPAAGSEAPGAPSAPSEKAAKEEPQAYSRPPQPAAPTPATPPAADAASQAEGARAEARPQLRALAKAQSPEDELERIAALRREGRHEEADRALAEFRRRYPDFRISEEMLKRVEK